MNRLIVLAMASVVTLTLSACGSEVKTSKQTTKTTEMSTPAAAPAAPAAPADERAENDVAPISAEDQNVDTEQAPALEQSPEQAPEQAQQ